ncbi:MAG: BrnA antitoxin family protein [Minwuia sp.]|nr:BrnA antitoxin family protein [Minwuia sp.]
MTISKKRLVEIDAIPDAAIDRSDIAALDPTFFANARLMVPGVAGKTPVTLRIDADVLAWFKAQGKGHLTRMNAVLRAYMAAHSDR